MTVDARLGLSWKKMLFCWRNGCTFLIARQIHVTYPYIHGIAYGMEQEYALWLKWCRYMRGFVKLCSVGTKMWLRNSGGTAPGICSPFTGQTQTITPSPPTISQIRYMSVAWMIGFCYETTSASFYASGVINVKLTCFVDCGGISWWSGQDVLRRTNYRILE